MGDKKTYFVAMQDNFNALYRPCLCGYVELKRNKCDVPVMPMMCLS